MTTKTTTIDTLEAGDLFALPKTTTIDTLEAGDLFALPRNGETRVFIRRGSSDLGEDVRKVTFLGAEGKTHVEPIGKNVAVTLVAKDTEIRDYKDRRGRVLRTRAEIADGLIWPFADSSLRRSKALEVLASKEIAEANLRAEHFEVSAESYRVAIERNKGVEFGDARSRHKDRNCMMVAILAARALRALDA